jgi:hypothetical protein
VKKACISGPGFSSGKALKTLGNTLKQFPLEFNTFLRLQEGLVRKQ